jgi:hypothetical protein
MINQNETKAVAIAKYKKSVEALLEIAQMGTGGSGVAAQVLLSAYNGDHFHLDVTDLGRLDSKNMLHALQVLWGRNHNPWIEPHKVIENGDAVFCALWDNFRRLHVQNRWKSECYDCNGRGWHWVNPDDENDESKESCRRCGGRGLLDEVQWPGYEGK